MAETFRFHEHALGAVSIVSDSAVFRDQLSDYFRYLHRVSPHYRGVMEGLQRAPDADPLDLLERFPVTDKEIYRNVLQVEAMDQLRNHSFVTDYSSGSTAKCVLRLCRAADDLCEQDVTETVFWRIDMRPGDHFVCMDVGAPEIYDFYFRAARNLGLTRMSYLNLTRDYAWSSRPLQALSPTVLLTVPSLLVRAWPHVRGLWNRGMAPIRALVHMGEAMHPEFRAEVMATWGCHVYSFYGTTEIGGLGANCGASDGIHFDPTMVVPTVESPRWIDRETLEGEVLFTTLHIHTQSVVKYRVGDLVRLTTAPCHCGDPSPRLWFRERTHDAFVIAGEKFRYNALLAALQEAVPALRLLSVEIEDLSDAEGHTLLRLILTEEMLPHREALLEVLQVGIFELDSIYRYGLVRFDLRFEPASYFEGRKVPRVVDRRQHMSMPPAAPEDERGAGAQPRP